MISKCQERSPLKYQIVHCMPCIAPINLINKKDECNSEFSKIVEKLYQRKLLPSKEVDDSKLQFKEFIDNVVKSSLDQF